MSRDQLDLFDDPAMSPTLREVADAVREAGIEGMTGAAQRADQARYQEVHVRSALTATKGMPFKWALNPYRGCTHACEYCYARKYQKHLELGAGDEFSSFILVKRNLPDVLARELSRQSWGRENVAVGTATDPYQPIEGHYRITRRCLERLHDSGTPFSIVTKGPMIVRDIELLVRATHAAGCRVFFSIATVGDAWERLEPGTAPPAQRLRAARRLTEAGIDTAVLMMPLVPGLSTSRLDITRTVAAIAESGVRFAGANVARLDPAVREHFFAFLEKEFPSLLPGYGRLYQKHSARADYCAAVDQVVREVRNNSEKAAAAAAGETGADHS